MALHGANDGDLVHLTRKPREKPVREIQVVTNLPYVKILRRALAFFEVKRVDMTDCACQLDNNRKAGCTARVGLTGGPRPDGPQLLVRKSGEQAVAA